MSRVVKTTSIARIKSGQPKKKKNHNFEFTSTSKMFSIAVIKDFPTFYKKPRLPSLQPSPSKSYKSLAPLPN